MRKPDVQWETARYRARRAPEPDRRVVGEARAESFRLEPRDGRGDPVEVHCSLRRQVAPREVVAGDPGLVHALKCWLGARGGREFALEDEDGVAIAGGPFAIRDLGLDEAQGVVGSERAVRGAVPNERLGAVANEQGRADLGAVANERGGANERVALDRSSSSSMDRPLTPRPPRTLITLAPSNAEIVAALGCFDRVIACEDSTDFPAEAAACERLGPDLGPDLDRIAALAPDLVLASLSVPGMERVVTGLRARGVPHLVLAPRSFDEVLAEVRAVGERLGVSAAAEAVVRGMEAERAALRAAAPPRPVRVYLEWWPRPMFTPGRECYSNELIALAGGVNVFGGRPGSSLEVSAAELQDADPEVCFVSWCGVPAAKLDPGNLIGRAGLEGLRAARVGRVYPVDEAFSGRPGPRMLEAARIMAAAIREVAAALG